MTKEEFITKARAIHGDKYDYSLLPETIKYKENVRIKCPVHGEFIKDFEHHYYKHQGCPKCSGKKRYNNDEFIDKIKNLPSTKNLSFENCNYVNSRTKIQVFCHEKDDNGKEHGIFYISPTHLLSGEGCPVCRYVKSASAKRRSLEEVIKTARNIYGDKYDYSMITEYKNDRTKYPIICPTHGVFYKTMNNHINNKQGCPICSKIKSNENRKITFETFKNLSNEIHDNRYEYLEETFIDMSSNVGIVCPKHGVFYQRACNHLNLGYDCPKCSCEKTFSRGEKELLDFIYGIYGGKIEENKRGIFTDNKEIDIFLPDLKIGFEYDGLYWHSELSKDKNYHLNKTKGCESQGIHLFHIFEDEWFNKKEIIKSMIKNLIGVTENKIFARKCLIKEVNFNESKDFLNKNHLQGNAPSSVRLGLYYNNELVSLMIFGKSRHFIGNNKNKWELIRFCNKINTTVIGGASKLFTYFLKENQPNEIISYADRRWSKGNLYDKLGFVKYNESKPNYYYIINQRRVYRFNLRKSVLIKKYGCPENMSEQEFCLQQKWYRIYDCGCLCYIWKNEK